MILLCRGMIDWQQRQRPKSNLALPLDTLELARPHLLSVCLGYVYDAGSLGDGSQTIESLPRAWGISEVEDSSLVIRYRGV